MPEIKFKFAGSLKLLGDSSKISKSTGLAVGNKLGSELTISAKLLSSADKSIQVTFTVDGKTKLEAYYTKWPEAWIYQTKELHLSLKWPLANDKKLETVLLFNDKKDADKVFQFFRDGYKKWFGTAYQPLKQGTKKPRKLSNRKRKTQTQKRPDGLIHKLFGF